MTSQRTMSKRCILKIYNYSQTKNNDLMYDGEEVNYFFVYVTLKNMYLDDYRKSKKKILVNIEDVILIEEPSEYSEDKFYLQRIWLVIG